MLKPDGACPRWVLLHLDRHRLRDRGAQVIGLVAGAAAARGRRLMMTDLAAARALERQVAVTAARGVAGNAGEAAVACV
jgi:predicted amidohydrolase